MRFALLALAFAGSALAQPVPQATPGAASFPVSTVRNISTIGTGTINPSNVGRYAFAHVIGGNVVADATTGLPLPDGRTLPVTVRSTIPKASATAAIGRFLRKGLPFVGTGVALYDLAQELGYDLDTNGGDLVITKPDPTSCTVAPCYEYQYTSTSPVYATGWLRSLQSVASADVSLYNSSRTATSCAQAPNQSFRTAEFLNITSANAYRIVLVTQACQGTLNFGEPTRTNIQTRNAATRTRPVDPPGVPVPVTPEEFDTAINNKNDWQPSSALGRSLVDAIKAGELVQAPPQTATGPASTPGPVKTTTDAVNNTTKTETTRYDHSYSGPNVTTTINTTTVTVDNSTGATISSTTTTEQPTLPEKTQEEEEDTTFSNADLPPIPKLYDPEFPDGLEGVWNDRKAQLLDTSLFQLIPSLMPNMGDGGCPTWSIPSIYGGNLNASIPCSVWYFIRLVIILSALLLARRLIFGG